MKKWFFLFSVFFAVILSICCGIMPTTVLADAPQAISSKSAILVDYDSNQVLFEKNSHDKVPVASMVKMMTILLTMEEIENQNISLSDMVTTSENASGMGGSQVFIDPFVQYKVEDLLKSVIVASANDASVALAEHICGNEPAFVKKMNQRAKQLGMNDTNYKNCTGLPAAEQFSSAFDSAIVLREVTKHDLYHSYSTIWQDELVHPSGRKTSLVNTNRLVRYYQGCDGGKTGSTNEAGCCLAATAKRGDMRLVGVIVGAKDSKTRFNECSSLFNYGFANFSITKLVETQNPIATVNVSKGKISQTQVFAEESFSALLKKGDGENYKIETSLPNFVKAPAKYGQSVGKVMVYKDGVLVKEINLIVKQDVQKMSLMETIEKIGEKW